MDRDLDRESLDLGDPFSLDGDRECEYEASDLCEPSDSLECDLDIRNYKARGSSKSLNLNKENPKLKQTTIFILLIFCFFVL